MQERTADMNIIKKINEKRRALRNKINWEKHKLSDYYYTYISTKTKEYHTSLGFKLRTRGYIANKLMVASKFETTEMNILKQLIETSDVFVDVGANIGYYTCLACSLGKKALAFEPQPNNLSCLLANIQTNNFTSLAEVFPVGLGEAPGILTLFGASGPSASLINGWAGYSNKFRQMIPVNTLDTILSGRYMNNAMAIKIDVEGAEFHVLKGAINTLNRKIKPTWFLEICLDQFHPDALNKNFLETFQLFFDSGYDAYIADKEKTAVTIEDVRNWVINRSTVHSEFNYVFVPSPM
jgi:FkbM family methyltransferase